MYQIAEFRFIIREDIDDVLDVLAGRVRDGDTSAFDQIDMALRPQVSRMSYRYMNHFHEREDMEQDMMEAALRLCYRYQGERGRYRHYLLRTLRFEMKAHTRRYSLKSHNEGAVFNDLGIQSADEKNDDPINMIVKEEQLQYLMRKKGICSPLERRVLEHIDKGHDIEDVCREFALGRKSVVNTLHRIRRKKERLVLAEQANDAFDNAE
ncbi:RNA polymerase sigma factor [Salinicoccus sesuvii]|uniref:RNA polymerase sigma factor n=1 Tax=Salinicoccus sesuvii TaxID=868281 RepID=A0ABV7N3K7_9STAP